MAYKVTIIVSCVILSIPGSPELQTIVCLIISTVALIFHLECKPFSSEELNRLQTLSFTVFLVMMFIGLFYSKSSNYILENEGASWFFLILLIIANFSFYLYWLYIARIELLKELYSLTSRKTRFIFKVFACITRKQFFEKYKKKVQSKTNQNQEEAILLQESSIVNGQNPAQEGRKQNEQGKDEYVQGEDGEQHILSNQVQPQLQDLAQIAQNKHQSQDQLYIRKPKKGAKKGNNLLLLNKPQSKQKQKNTQNRGQTPTLDSSVQHQLLIEDSRNRRGLSPSELDHSENMVAAQTKLQNMIMNSVNSSKGSDKVYPTDSIEGNNCLLEIPKPNKNIKPDQVDNFRVKNNRDEIPNQIDFINLPKRRSDNEQYQQHEPQKRNNQYPIVDSESRTMQKQQQQQYQFLLNQDLDYNPQQRSQTAARQERKPVAMSNNFHISSIREEGNTGGIGGLIQNFTSFQVEPKNAACELQFPQENAIQNKQIDSNGKNSNLPNIHSSSKAASRIQFELADQKMSESVMHTQQTGKKKKKKKGNKAKKKVETNDLSQDKSSSQNKEMRQTGPQQQSSDAVQLKDVNKEDESMDSIDKFYEDI